MIFVKLTARLVYNRFYCRNQDVSTRYLHALNSPLLKPHLVQITIVLGVIFEVNDFSQFKLELLLEVVSVTYKLPVQYEPVSGIKAFNSKKEISW